MRLSKTAGAKLTTDLRLVPLGFAALILVGAALLSLPWAHRDGRCVGAIDTIFLSTSAACVTGLSTVNVAETYTGFGQFVILGLIQLGGLGIMTAGTLFVLLAGRRLSISDEHLIKGSIGGLKDATPGTVFAHALGAVFLMEVLGALGLFALLSGQNPEVSWWQRAFEAVFHSVSAFCNAGISIYPEGLARWRKEPYNLMVIEGLVILGGIGLLTLVNLRFYRGWKRNPLERGYLTLQTRLIVVMAALLVAGGAVVTLLFERDHTLAGLAWPQAAGEAVFHSVMTRTAGYSLVEVQEMDPNSLIVTMVLMLIGGAPGSMAGGLKTTTVALLCLGAWAALRRRPEVQLGRRRIPPQQAWLAIMFTLLTLGLLLLAIMALTLCETGEPAGSTRHHWLALVFEVVSAFGTTGLTAGITPLLTSAGKLVIVLTMFAGRVAPLLLALYLQRPVRPWNVRYPPEELSMG